MAKGDQDAATVAETVIPPVAGPASRARAREQAEAGADAANAEADALEARAKIVARRDPVAINRATEDALGRKLPKDPDEARAMQREAVAEKQRRVLEDTDRVNHGLEPKYATE